MEIWDMHGNPQFLLVTPLFIPSAVQKLKDSICRAIKAADFVQQY